MTDPFLTNSVAALWLASADRMARQAYEIDAHALLGAVAGAAVFALHAPPATRLKRALQFFVSVLIGYAVAAEIDRLLPVNERSVCAFIGAALAVAVMNAALDTLAEGDLITLWQRLRRARHD
jgi:hypothetical protein